MGAGRMIRAAKFLHLPLYYIRAYLSKGIPKKFTLLSYFERKNPHCYD